MERVLGPFGPLYAFDRYQAGFLRDGSGRFLLATGDGGTLLRLTDGSRVDLLRLDPEVWKDRLCEVLGHEPAEDERRGLPRWLPREICPA